MLLRLLFPSWAFFDAVTDIPVLEVRVMTPQGEPGPWQPVVVPRPRGVRQLLFNPEGTERLAVQAIVDRFAVECETGAPDPVSRALVHRVAVRAVLEAPSHGRSPARHDHVRWQWRVGAVSAATDGGSPDAHRSLYTSAIIDGAADADAANAVRDS